MNSLSTAIEHMPDTALARLPATYEAARTAIAACDKIDECKEWSDKAAALASYARQAKNDELRVMAVRIQARALRRAGELLRQISPGHGARDGKRQEGNLPPLTRMQAGENAGLSEHQRKSALRLSSIADDELDRLMRSDGPLTVTCLVEHGTRKRPRSERQTDGDTDIARGVLQAFCAYCAENEPGHIARAISTCELDGLQLQIFAIDQWLNVFVDNLPTSVKPLNGEDRKSVNRKTTGPHAISRLAS